jgi:hypothetical protein
MAQGWMRRSLPSRFLISLGATNLSMTILTHDHTDLPEISLKQKEHLFAHYANLEPDKVVKI